nr:DEAD/DEAH box helicase family protein [Quadrisphaera sp. RL12-1S]
MPAEASDDLFAQAADEQPRDEQPGDPGAVVGPVESHGGRPLRAWQAQALGRYEAEKPTDYLVTATPGAGKTTFALTLASRLLARREVARVVVVAPTDHLRTQWAEAADAAGIVLDPTLTNAVGPVRAGTKGYVTTYAQVAGKPALHAARCTAAKTLVILDEVHHAGDGLSWGEAAEEAFDRAARRLCLTGTPFRTKPGERIPFVRYSEVPDGEPGELRSAADYTYGYREALRDGVVRPVVFAAYTGTARWRNSAGEVIAASLSEPSTKSVEATAWKTVLDPKGQWVPHVIAAVDERITHLRAHGMPDAAGLVLASDQDDARAYAAIVKKVTGTKPELILSDDPTASKKIEKFGTGTTRIAVCVRMVSEGVDVPRAAVLAWMTSYRTPLFFAQAVGRVVRSRGPHEAATVFLPAVRPLLTLAASMEEERNHVIPPPAEASEDLDPLPPRERAAGETREWRALDADAQFAHVLHGGRAVLAGSAPAELSEEDGEHLGLLAGMLTPEQTAHLLSQRDEEHRRAAAAAAVQDDLFGGLGGDDGGGGRGAGAAGGPDSTAGRFEPDEGQAGWRAAAELRREVNQLVARVASRSGEPHARVHVALRKAVPGPASASASVEVLEKRRDFLLAQL